MCVWMCACVLCMILFRVLILTVGHDNTPKCMCMLCMTLFRVLVLTVGHDSLLCVCVCVCVCVKKPTGVGEWDPHPRGWSHSPTKYMHVHACIYKCIVSIFLCFLYFAYIHNTLSISVLNMNLS